MNDPVLDIDITLERSGFQLLVREQLCMSGLWGVMGASGCGKTSLLRCIAGLECHARGSIGFANRIWQHSATKALVPAEKRGIGYIFQEARLFPHLDVMGNLAFARKRASVSEGRLPPDFNGVVQQLGISHLLSRRVGNLSGGEKQRVAIARTLLNAPSLLLMDEPLASLDWQSKLDILPLLRRVQRHFKVPVIIVSHAREELARIADHLLIMDAGQVVDRGRCRSVLMGTDAHNERNAGKGSVLSVLEGKVLRHDSLYPLTEICVENQVLTVNQVGLEPGSDARVVLSASDVSIFLEKTQGSSMQNQLTVVIERVQELSSHQMLLSLSLGEQSLLSLITRKSMSLLSLSIGQKVYAHFKAAGLDVY